MQNIEFKWCPSFKGLASLNDCIEAHKMGWDVIIHDGRVVEIKKEVKKWI